MSRTLAALPAHLRRRLEAALRLGALAPPWSPVAVRAALGSGPDVPAIAAALGEDAATGRSAGEIAAWLRGFEAGEGRVSAPDLVWSGPQPPGVHARETRRVYEEMLGAATRSLWISTYAFFDGRRAFESLARRLDSTPALEATLLLNLHRAKGDTSLPRQVVRRFAARFWSEEWPGSRRPRIFYDPRALEPEGGSGVLHAKALVADDSRVFITSANLTEAAFDSNIEIGLLLRDRALALGVASHFRGLIERGLLLAAPPA